MSPRLGVRITALVLGVLAAAAPAPAADYESARRFLELSPDPIERSPRLLGMGRLTWVGRDPNNRVALWDFAGNPTGIFHDDTTSSFDLRPSTASADSKRDDIESGGTRLRQELGAREVRVGYELWSRADHTVYGATGSLSALRLDTPSGEDVERRSKFGVPSIMAVLGGDLPFLEPGRWGYALRFQYESESSDDEYRTFVRNASGEYLDQDGVTVLPPNLFDPTHVDVNTRSLGAALSYRFGDWLTMALGGDLATSEINGENTGSRHTSSLTEQRPYNIGQASLVGQMGELEYGLDGRMWEGSSEADWVFTISAGQSATPLSGRGEHHTRDEHGNRVRGRARWTLGDLEVGGGISTGFRKVTLNPPADEPGSFNRFLAFVYQRGTADSLALPDSVSFRRDEIREWSAGGGVSWRLLGGRALWGAELNVTHAAHNVTSLAEAIDRSGWNATTGLEYGVTPVLTGRAGYRYRTDDRNENLELDEYQGHAVTVGLGYAPIGSIWSFDAGWLLEWLNADFEDPLGTHGSRQQLGLQMRWTF